jgi:hypothetical protein
MRRVNVEQARDGDRAVHGDVVAGRLESRMAAVEDECPRHTVVVTKRTPRHDTGLALGVSSRHPRDEHPYGYT